MQSGSQLEEQNKKLKKEQEKAEQNLRLKRQLAVQLWNHHCLEKKEAPYETNKAKKVSYKELFFLSNEVKKPAEVKAKRVVSKSESEPVNTSSFISQHEKRMKELNERRL